VHQKTCKGGGDGDEEDADELSVDLLDGTYAYLYVPVEDDPVVTQEQEQQPEDMEETVTLTFHCHLCEAYFPTYLGLCAHVDESHAPDISFVCETCKSSFASCADWCQHTCAPVVFEALDTTSTRFVAGECHGRIPGMEVYSEELLRMCYEDEETVCSPVQ
jgi:hypothetical protein